MKMPTVGIQQLVSRYVELQDPEQFVLQTKILEPDALQKHEIAAETLCTAISPGTEIAAYRGEPPLRPGKAYPRLVGYCNVAKVIATGSQVTKYKVGDRILTFQSHRTAFICPENSVITVVPESVSDADASTTYLFHLGYDALLKSKFFPGHKVGIVGLGTLGFSTLMMATRWGGQAIGFSSRRFSLEQARRWGLPAMPKTDICERFDEYFPDSLNEGMDIVINTSNRWDDYLLSLKLARKGGRVCLMGFPGRGQTMPDFNPLASQYIYDKQLTVFPCGYTSDADLPAIDMRFNIQRNCSFLLDSIAAGKLESAALISKTVSWTVLEDIYQDMAKGDFEGFTVVLEWQAS
jgi:D-arabinose 1-dehydrogenase-like Zn-dependent alcohol dehydrogenase